MKIHQHKKYKNFVSYKNYLLLLTPLIGHLYTLFRGSSERVSWWLTDNTRRIDYAVMYYSISINFLILSFCLMYPKGINKKVRKFILILSSLDMMHLMLVSKLKFGIFKILLAFIIYSVTELLESKSLKNKSWIKQSSSGV
jgi:hypothetical protein